MVRTPRWPNSMARPMPTGPPPTMTTSASNGAELAGSLFMLCLLRGDALGLDQVGPAFGVCRQQLRKRLRRAGGGRHALGLEGLGDGRLRQDLVQLLVQALDVR